MRSCWQSLGLYGFVDCQFTNPPQFVYLWSYGMDDRNKNDKKDCCFKEIYIALYIKKKFYFCLLSYLTLRVTIL